MVEFEEEIKKLK